jgi:hypothetical protein
VTPFTPVKDFYSENFRSHYCAGLTYRVRPGNVALAAAVEEWRKSGLVTVATVPGGLSNVGDEHPTVWERIKSWLSHTPRP